ncbi:MAG: hypothetical protein AAGA03_05410 [Planctomycetota bacterium]
MLQIVDQLTDCQGVAAPDQSSLVDEATIGLVRGWIGMAGDDMAVLRSPGRMGPNRNDHGPRATGTSHGQHLVVECRKKRVGPSSTVDDVSARAFLAQEAKPVGDRKSLVQGRP